jgi:hypothetical protein
VVVIAMLVALTDLWSASLLLLWAVGAFHTTVNARRRFANASTRRVWAAVAVLVPLAGHGAYLLVRPAETLAERRLRRRRLLYLELVARGAHRSFEAQPATR